MRMPLSEKVENAIEQIPSILTTISESLRVVPTNDGELFSQYAKRLADVEARIQKIETLLITKTFAGKDKLTDEGKKVGKKWYEQN